VPQPHDHLGAGNGPDCGEHSERDFLNDRHAELRPARADDFSLNRPPALAFCLSMIFSENRCALFWIMR
jgi:hypothetical protein